MNSIHIGIIIIIIIIIIIVYSSMYISIHYHWLLVIINIIHIIIIIISISSSSSTISTVSFHNFKSQDFKFSVSNPKSKYAAYSSVLSRISNCQGLGRKNKHEILKTDRMIIIIITMIIITIM